MQRLPANVTCTSGALLSVCMTVHSAPGAKLPALPCVLALRLC